MVNMKIIDIIKLMIIHQLVFSNTIELITPIDRTGLISVSGKLVVNDQVVEFGWKVRSCEYSWVA
jgi:hypothetical protein